MTNNGTIVDATTPQVIKKQTKQLSWKTKLVLTIGITFLLCIILIVVNTYLVIGATGPNLAFRIIWSALIDTILLTVTLCGCLMIILTRILSTMSVKLVGANYFHSVLKPWLIAIMRGLLTLISWKIWEWAKASQQQPNWQPGAGWTQTGN